MFQVLTLFFCIIVFFLNHIVKTSKSNKKKVRDQSRAEANVESSEYALYLVLPMIVAFNMPMLFIIVALLLVCLRVIVFIKNFRHLKIRARISGLIMNFVWASYIAGYTVLLYMNWKKEEDDELDSKEQQIVVTCGLYIIICLLFGGLVELASCFCIISI